MLQHLNRVLTKLVEALLAIFLLRVNCAFYSYSDLLKHPVYRNYFVSMVRGLHVGV